MTSARLAKDPSIVVEAETLKLRVLNPEDPLTLFGIDRKVTNVVVHTYDTSCSEGNTPISGQSLFNFSRYAIA